MNRLSFIGAAQEVTGSCYLLRTESGKKFLLDCGMHQGANQVTRLVKEKFPFSVSDIDGVILSHAHIDHSGLLPLLVARGYRGPIYCTTATRELLDVMLSDTVSLYLRDLEWENKRRHKSRKLALPPEFTQEDVELVLQLSEGLEYHQHIQLDEDVGLRFLDAGHILGSAIVELDLRSDGKRRKLVFSGDLGNPQTVLMNTPEQPEQADLVLMEGTYGNRNHKSLDATIEELESILKQAADSGGNVLIPAFALGRTQEVLYHLAMLYHQGRLPQQRIFLDSPMAIAITQIYSRFLDQLSDSDLARLPHQGASRLEDVLPIMRLCSSPEESQAINRVHGGAIIIAGSGMCNGGRIRHHLRHNVSRRNCHLVVVGFQARGTLGRRLVDGAQSVTLFGESHPVRIQVHTLGGFSAHAGQAELRQWVGAIKGNPRVQLVHGEPEALETLQDILEKEDGIRADIPGPGSTVSI